MDVNANINKADCIVTMSSWGHNTVHNICTGTVRTVQWGSIDYLTAIGAIGFILAVIAIIAALAFGIVRMVLSG